MLKIRFIIFFYDKLFIPLKHQAGFTKANQVQGLKTKKKKAVLFKFLPCYSSFCCSVIIKETCPVVSLWIQIPNIIYKFLSFPKNFLGSLTHQIHQKTNMGKSLGEF